MLLKDIDHKYTRIIEEHIIPGKRLGRHVIWNPERLNKSVEPFLPAGSVVKTQLWVRTLPIFNQGEIGDCTANAALGMATTTPFATFNAGKTLVESNCVTDYEYETQIDGLGDPYPPNDRGSSGDAAIKALIHFGYATTEHAALDFQTALLTVSNYGPTIWGMNWYSNFDNPDSTGLVTYGGSIRGGHEIENIGIDAEKKLLKFANSWGDGWGDQGYFYLSFEDAEKLFNEEGTVDTMGIQAVPATA